MVTSLSIYIHMHTYTYICTFTGRESAAHTFSNISPATVEVNIRTDNCTSNHTRVRSFNCTSNQIRALKGLRGTARKNDKYHEPPTVVGLP